MFSESMALDDGETVTRPPSAWRDFALFFEEWDNPLVSGIRWVEELVEIAGGEPIFPELRDAKDDRKH